MKKAVAIALSALVLLSALSACSVKGAIRAALKLDGEPVPVETLAERSHAPRKTGAPTATPAETPEPAPEPTPEPTAEPVNTPAPTQGQGLSGNRQDISMEEIVEYFKQVVFGNDANKKLLKWVDPIVVSVSGDRTAQDDELLTGIFDQMNEYDGFPRITYREAAGADANVNFEIVFTSEAEMKKLVPDWNGKFSCNTYYDNNDNMELYNAKIYLISEWTSGQSERDMLMSWAAFFCMGLLNFSDTYYDSVFTNYYSQDGVYNGGFTKPATIDWYMFSALYYKEVKAGMTMQQAVEALNK